MAIRNYPYPGYRKRLKSTHRLIKHINTCTSHQIFSIHIQPKQNTPILGKEAHFGPHKNEKLTLEEQDIEGNHKNLGCKSLDTETV